MQNKGFVKVFAVLLTLDLIYYFIVYLIPNLYKVANIGFFSQTNGNKKKYLTFKGQNL